MTQPQTSKNVPERRAVPGLKRQDGTYVPAVVPPEWQAEQTRLAKLVEQTNAHLNFSAAPPFEGLKYIAGVDISFVKGTQEACAMLVVLKYPELTVAYKASDIVTMTEEYVPFYLAFREVRHLVKLFERMKVEATEMFPQIVFVDGGGVWHPKGLGLASHLGVLLGITTIGIAKSLLYLPDIPPTLTYDSIRAEMDTLNSYYPVRGESGTLYGAAVIARNAAHVERPIFVSVGNMIELDTAVELVHATSMFRIPEAIRAADGGSREVLRLLEEKRLHENNQ